MGSIGLFLVPFYLGRCDSSLFIFKFPFVKDKVSQIFMAFWCISFMRVLMLGFEILRLINLLMDCSCIAPLTFAVIVMRGFIFHPLFCMLLINGSYLACLYVRACLGNLSWKYVNSMNCIMCVGASSIGVGTVGVLEFERPKNVFSMVAHVLGISKF